ncbi:MAG: hypothetical protein SOW59_06695 [Corynebacterium sp.]|nr:hypothetical protein [Corynebacterium sp.]
MTSHSSTGDRNSFADAPSTETMSALQREKQLAVRLELGKQRVTLVAALVLYVGWLTLPHSGEFSGWELILGRGSFTIAEYIFATFLTFGVGILTTATVTTKRTVVGQLAWMTVTLACASSLFMAWMRSDSVETAGPGLWCGVLSAFLATIAFSVVTMRKTPEQLAAQESLRLEAGRLDEVGHMQMNARPVGEHATHTHLIDDRRKQAVLRHRDI